MTAPDRKGDMKKFNDSRVLVLVEDELFRESLTETIRSWGLCAEDFNVPEAAVKNVRENNPTTTFMS